MTKAEIIAALDAIIDAAQVGVLATVSPEGWPATRWMTVAAVRGRPGYLYSVSAPDARKVRHIQTNPVVEWTFQSPELNLIVTVTGRMSAIDNPQLKSEVLEAIGPRLEVFWRVQETMEFIVVETAIDEISVFEPMKQRHETTTLGEEDRQ
jgi:pyridoxamine 5'-phosphate oxidase